MMRELNRPQVELFSRGKCVKPGMSRWSTPSHKNTANGEPFKHFHQLCRKSFGQPQFWEPLVRWITYWKISKILKGEFCRHKYSLQGLHWKLFCTSTRKRPSLSVQLSQSSTRYLEDWSLWPTLMSSSFSSLPSDWYMNFCMPSADVY